MERPDYLTLLPPFEPEKVESLVTPINIHQEQERERSRVYTENLNAQYRQAFLHIFSHLPIDYAVVMWNVLGTYSMEEAAEKAGLPIPETQRIIDESNAIAKEIFPQHARGVFNS